MHEVVVEGPHRTHVYMNGIHECDRVSYRARVPGTCVYVVAIRSTGPWVYIFPTSSLLPWLPLNEARPKPCHATEEEAVAELRRFAERVALAVEQRPWLRDAFASMPAGEVKCW